MIHSTGAAPVWSTQSRNPSARGPAAGTARRHPGTVLAEASAITGPCCGQRESFSSLIALRFSISSTSTVAAVLSAAGNSPGRTTTTAFVRSMPLIVAVAPSAAEIIDNRTAVRPIPVQGIRFIRIPAFKRQGVTLPVQFESNCYDARRVALFLAVPAELSSANIHCALMHPREPWMVCHVIELPT